MELTLIVVIVLTLLVIVVASIVRVVNPGWTRTHPIAFVVLTVLSLLTAVKIAISVDGLRELDADLWNGWLRAAIAAAAFFWIVRSLGVLTEPSTIVLGFSGPNQDTSGTWYEVAGSVTNGRGLITEVTVDMVLERAAEGQTIRFERLSRHDLIPGHEFTTGDPSTTLSVRYEHAAWHSGHEPGPIGRLYFETGAAPELLRWEARGHGWQTHGKVKLAD